MRLILLNKPYQVLCQFTDEQQRSTLADYIDTRNVYPAGRLDFDSEGLLALTDDGALQATISSPKSKLLKHYWAQVEGVPVADQITALLDGVVLKDGLASARSASVIDEPEQLWPRNPPIRHRKTVPDSWIDLSIDEGRNRQVRRMTAATGLPTLRLIRHRIGPWQLAHLRPGESIEFDAAEAWQQFKATSRR